MWYLSQPLHQLYSFFYFDVHLCFLSSPLQAWRLITNFLFFGPLGFSFLFNMIFLYPFLAVGRLWYVEEVCTQKHILRVSVCLLCITAVWLVCSCAVGHLSLCPWLSRYRYCRMLEEGSFRGRTADFVYMFLFGGVLMTVSFSVHHINNNQECISSSSHVS